MKFFTSRLFLLLLAVTFATALYAQTDTVTVIFVTDTHSHLTPWGEKDETGKGTIGGFARAATVIKSIMDAEKNPLLVHSGDLFVGDFMFNKFYGVPELKMLIDLGLRVMCVGNHEFDLGPDRLKTTIAEAEIPSSDLELVTADVDMSKDPELATLVKPYTVVPIGNLKIGFFGLTPSMANTFSHPAPDSITDFMEAAKGAVAALEPQCDAIIGLTHLDVANDDSLAATIPEIDLIIGGHAHVQNYEPRMVSNTPIVRAGCFYKYVGVVKVEISPSGLEILHHELIPIDNNVLEDPEIAAKIDSLVAEVEADARFGKVYTEIIAEANTELSQYSGYGFKDAPLGNLITDAMRDATGTQIGLDVGGWMGQSLCAGPINGNDIFQSVPYGYDPETGLGFKLSTFTIMGYMLQSALEVVIDASLDDSSYDLQISNAQIIYDSTQPVGSKIQSFLIDGQPINALSSYSVTVSDGLADFLYIAGLSFITPVETGLSEYHVVRDFIIANSPLNYVAEGRLQDVSQTDVPTRTPEQVPQGFVLHQNFPNPFNPTTSITFKIPGNGLQKNHTVLLQVFDLLGNEVVRLVDEQRPVGIYNERWEAVDRYGNPVASGIYLYRLQVDGTSAVKKMVLAR